MRYGHAAAQLNLQANLAADSATDLQREFWSSLREEIPGSILIAEAYWDTAMSLLDLGLDFV